MIAYVPHTSIADAEFASLGDPEGLGGKLIQGLPKLSARIDYQKDVMAGGIFEATTGIVEVHMPFTQHATVIEGEVTITDELGTSHTYKLGDTYLIKQGQVIIWEVSVQRVRLSFLTVVERADDLSNNWLAILSNLQTQG
jgi:uncharacterized protein